MLSSTLPQASEFMTLRKTKTRLVSTVAASAISLAIPAAGPLFLSFSPWPLLPPSLTWASQCGFVFGWKRRPQNEPVPSTPKSSCSWCSSSSYFRSSRLPLSCLLLSTRLPSSTVLCSALFSPRPCASSTPSLSAESSIASPKMWASLT